MFSEKANNIPVLSFSQFNNFNYLFQMFCYNEFVIMIATHMHRSEIMFTEIRKTLFAD